MNIKLKIPDNFLIPETRSGFFVSAKMKRVWAVELDLLNEFSRVCQKHNIKWFVDAGTLLGTVRHQGMIPWDDDIDVALMRDEYEKLCEIAPSEFRQPYFFQTEETDKGSLRCHAQLRNSDTTGILKTELKDKFKFNQGIFIDIFPLDTKTANELLFKKQCEKLADLKSKMYIYRFYKDAYQFKFRWNLIKYFGNILRQLLSNTLLRKRFDYESLSREFDKTATLYNADASDYVCYFCLQPISQRRIWEKHWYESSIDMKFEMLTVPVPIGWKEYLETFYGQWEKYVIGGSVHGDVLFDTETPYKEYLK